MGRGKAEGDILLNYYEHIKAYIAGWLAKVNQNK